MKKIVPVVLALLLSAPLLMGCYLPIRFDAEINLGRTGFYEIEFDGYIAALPLYTDLQKEALSPDEAEGKIAGIIADFKRDSATGVADHVRDGIFHVNWKRKGDIIKSKMVTFLRRNEKILNIKYLPDEDRVVMDGVSISTSNVENIRAAGLDIQGELRVRTDASVIEHNATEIKDVAGDDHTKIYVWKIKTASDPTPHLAAVLR